MSVAAGGKISQVIQPDLRGNDWLRNRTTVFNVQILNSAACKAVTGVDPPDEPIDVATYAYYGFPFFSMFEEPSGISGDFEIVKSVAQIKDSKEEVIEPQVMSLESEDERKSARKCSKASVKMIC